jgi:predicted DNA-binding protein
MVSHKEERKKVKAFTLSPSLLEKLKRMAKEEQRSESQVVNMMLEKHLA